MVGTAIGDFVPMGHRRATFAKKARSFEVTMMKQLAVAVRATAAAVSGLLRDLAGLSGVGLVAYGA